ncbi:MAG: hypothetical protein WCF85_08120 [Rhodospirillaceae bacterium]
MFKCLKTVAVVFGAVLLFTAPVFAQSASPSPAGQTAKPATGQAQPPATNDQSNQGATVSSGCKETMVEPTKGHVVCKDKTPTGDNKMVTPQGKHEKM